MRYPGAMHNWGLIACSSGLMVSDLGFNVQGLGFRVQGSGFRRSPWLPRNKKGSFL